MKNEAVQTLVRKHSTVISTDAAFCPRCPATARVEVLEKRPSADWYMCDNCGFVWRVSK